MKKLFFGGFNPQISLRLTVIRSCGMRAHSLSYEFRATKGLKGAAAAFAPGFTPPFLDKRLTLYTTHKLFPSKRAKATVEYEFLIVL